MRYNFSSLMLCFFALALAGVFMFGFGMYENTREPLVSPSDEVVDIGYENARKGDLSYSVSSVKPGKEDMVYSNMYDYLRGRVAGVEVGPDNTPSSVRIRGVNSINASTAPLVLDDALIRFDREKIKAAGYSDTVAVLLTNSDDLEGVECGLK